MKINMAENEYFPIGMKLCCKTCNGIKLQGEVTGFDVEAKVLILKCKSNGKNVSQETVINMQYVSEINVIQEPEKSPAPLSNLNLPKIAARANKTVEEKLRKVHYMGVGVTPQAQRLFHHITKTISEVRWDGQNIIILESVRIVSPYQLENVSLLKEKSARTQQTLDHVKKLVHKYYKDEEARESSVSSNASTSS